MTQKELRQKLAKLIIDNPEMEVVFGITGDNLWDVYGTFMNRLHSVTVEKMALTEALGSYYDGPDYRMKNDGENEIDAAHLAENYLMSEGNLYPSAEEIDERAKEILDSIEWKDVIYVTLEPCGDNND